MRVAIPDRRSTPTDVPGGLEVHIPAERSAAALAFMGVWLCFWAVAEVLVTTEMARGGERGFTGFFGVVWLTMWTLGGLFVIYSWLWTAFGEEIVRVEQATLSIKRDVLGLGLTREYELSAISNLRVVARRRHRAGINESVAFDYGARTIYFGDVDEAEAAMIVADLKKRHSFGEGAA